MSTEPLVLGAPQKDHVDISSPAQQKRWYKREQPPYSVLFNEPNITFSIQHVRIKEETSRVWDFCTQHLPETLAFKWSLEVIAVDYGRTSKVVRALTGISFGDASVAYALLQESFSEKLVDNDNYWYYFFRNSVTLHLTI